MDNKDSSQIETFFQTASKLTIVIPIVIILIALLLRFNEQSLSANKLVISPTVTPSIKITEKNSSLSSTDSAKLDLSGPFICNLTAQGSTLSAYIKDKKILVTLEEKSLSQSFLVRDGCVYMWDKGSLSGEKICGLESYISMAENLMKSNLLDLGTLLGNLTQFGNKSNKLAQNLDLSGFVNSCKKEQIKDYSVFNLPNQVLFKNKSLQ
jgi:hypothetical protein